VDECRSPAPGKEIVWRTGDEVSVGLIQDECYAFFFCESSKLANDRGRVDRSCLHVCEYIGEKEKEDVPGC
jgi:hypothetical protein